MLARRFVEQAYRVRVFEPRPRDARQPQCSFETRGFQGCSFIERKFSTLEVPLATELFAASQRLTCQLGPRFAPCPVGPRMNYWQCPGMQQHGDAKKRAEKGLSHFLTIVDHKPRTLPLSQICC